uniref:Uncharacterized protein n=1 Tax=Candidatus Kentrum sp. SD TaxID=2126332 RepID=A0A451BS16_9GAMM|nr:MAG: hypothetical protein BECKSD772F_GA0070984_11686 [Candidatus Kentron sp. SD]VFK44481.1 MAG: hypothetical protein BECKSD772E_GA0070983_103824 [Candidatus Kentron sp. SD]VFK81076.1 MAG: hypothetical protein BECKSD772D_GA0070982_12153 [Candidatus Kentron sp. SD]
MSELFWEERIEKHLSDLSCDILELEDRVNSFKAKVDPILGALPDLGVRKNVIMGKARDIIEDHYAEKIAHAVIVRDKEMFNND